jgi:pseudaminic acid synthase
MNTCRPSIRIAGREIGASAPPYVIAEMSANHNGRIENAFSIIKAACAAGADAVKLQTYRPDTITIDSDREEFRIRGGLWDGRTLFDLYTEAQTPWEWHKPLFAYARELGITIFSSPFDSTAVDMLEDLNVPAYKIASFEAVDLPLIGYVASTKKPMIISTGMANEEEISEAVETALSNGCKEIALLHCVSGYPAPAADYNLKTLTDMKSRFGVVTGLSDHTIDNNTAIAAVALGASVVEKHFTLDRLAGGPDDSFSIEPEELASLCKSAKIAWEAIGNVTYNLKSSESQNVKFRRSLYFVRNMKCGDLITEDCLRSIRPGYGLPPRELNRLIGRKLAVAVDFGTPASFDLIEKI